MAFTPTKPGPDYARLHSTLVNSKTQVQGPINNNALFQTISGLINGVKTFQDIVNSSFGTVGGILEQIAATLIDRNSQNFGCSLTYTNAVLQPAPDITEVILQFDTVVFDTGGMQSALTDITAPASAQYQVSGFVLFTGTGGNSRYLYFRRVGDIANLLAIRVRGTTDGAYNMSGLVFLNAGDVLQFIVMQDSGAPSTCKGAIQMVRISYT